MPNWVINLFFGTIALILLFVVVFGGTVAAELIRNPSVHAEGKTSSNCEVYATVEGVDRYACDDFARGYTCYDRAQGMTFCVPMTEEYK